MRMSLQYQYMLDMEKEKSQTALFKCYDFSGAKIILTVIGHLKGRKTLGLPSFIGVQSLTEVSRTIRYLEAENPIISL